MCIYTGHTRDMNTKTTAKTTAPALVGPQQLRKTLPAGSDVRVVTITTDGRLAYISDGRNCGYIKVSALVF